MSSANQSKAQSKAQSKDQNKTQNKTQNKPLTTEWPTGTSQMAKTTMGRLIGIGGCGTRRLTEKVTERFPDAKPFLRGDRATNKFTLSTKGSNAQKALKLMAQLVKDEVAWLEGRSSVCPHEHKSINANFWHSKNIIGALIGAKGAGLKRLTEKGGFILYKKSSSGEHSFFIEGLNSAMVTRMETALKDVATQLIAGQIASRPAEATIGSAAGISESDSEDEDDREDEEESKTNSLTKSAGNKGSTGSFDALVSSESDDDACPYLEAEAEYRRQEPSYAEYQQARHQIATARKVALDEVTGFEVNDYLDKKAQEKDEKMASTMTFGDFPAMNGNKEPISLQVSETTVWNKKPESILKKKAPQQLRHTSLDRQASFGVGMVGVNSSAPTAAAAGPPAPPMPVPGIMRRQHTMAPPRPRAPKLTQEDAVDSSDSDDEMPNMVWPSRTSSNWASDSEDDDTL